MSGIYLGWERPRAPRDDGTKAPWTLARAWPERKGGPGLAAAWKGDAKAPPDVERCYTRGRGTSSPPPRDGRWQVDWAGRPDSENGHDVQVATPAELERTRAQARALADENAALKAKLAVMAPKAIQP